MSGLNDAAAQIQSAAGEVSNQNAQAAAAGDAAAQLQEGLAQIESGLAALNNQSAEDAKKDAQTQATIKALTKGIDDVLTELTKNNDALTVGANALIAAGTGTGTTEEDMSLTQGADAVEAGIQKLQTTLQTYLGEKLDGGMLNTLKEGVDKLVDGIQQLQAGYDKVDEGTSSLLAGTNTLTASNKQLTSGATALESSGKTLTSGASKLTSASKQLNSGTSKITSATSQLTSGANTLSANSSKLNSGASQLASGTQTLHAGTQKLVSNNSKLNSGADQLADGAGQIQDGSSKLYDGSKELGDGITKLEDGSDTLATSLNDGAKEVKETNASDDTISMFATPITDEETKITTVENNGHAMAPYMMSVGLWVGCLAFCLMYPLTEHKGKLKSGFAWWASKASVLYPVAILQGVLLILLLHVLDGFTPVEMTKTILFAALTGACFTSIMYFFNITFGKVGSFLMLIFMVVQLAGSAGTYPVEISPSFVAKIHYYLPFTYTVNAFRSTICGGESIRQAVIVLIGLTIIFSILTILQFNHMARRKKQGKLVLLDWLEEKGVA